MPTSWYQAIPNILTQVKSINPQSILDIGVGFGKYGLLFRDLLEIPLERYSKGTWKVKMDGIEVFKNTITQFMILSMTKYILGIF